MDENNEERQIGYLTAKVEDLAAYVTGHMDREEARFSRLEKYVFRLYVLVGVLFILNFLESLGVDTSQFFFAVAKAAMGAIL